MRKRWIGYAVWLGLAACLYFFENNTGTRTVLLCSLLFPLLPLPRKAFFTADERKKPEEAPAPLTVRSFAAREADDPGDVRPYQPGDPIRRIHWKLSAKRDMLLVRETVKEPESVQEERYVSQPVSAQKKKAPVPWLLICLMAFCLALLLLLPEARRGAQALCNRVFAASERVNAYAYDYFPVPENQSVLLAAILIGFSAAALLALLIRGRLSALAVMAGCTFFQVYFGLSFPAWANVILYGLLGLRMMKRPIKRRNLLSCIAVLLAVFLAGTLLLPDVDAVTEAASETVRDELSRMAQQITGGIAELPEGETETRHIHPLSLQTGDSEAQTDREYRLVTVEEEQISMPRFINWLKMILLFLLLVGLIVLPFTPFLLLNARKKKAEEARRAFASRDVSEAVRAIFSYVLLWLRETGRDAENLLYRDWADKLPEDLPEGYRARFAKCAEDYEEAVYSDHALPEEKRLQALELLKETETALWSAADWKQRLRIRYWMCLCE